MIQNLTSALQKKIDKSTWQTYRFDELVHNIVEKVSPRESGLEKYIGLEHLDSGSLKIRRFGSTQAIKGDKLKIYKGDLIFAKRNSYLKRVAIADEDAVASAHSLVLRAKVENVNPSFLPFFLLSESFWSRAIQISVGSLSPTINWKVLARQEFLLPPKEQQAQLADLLWAMDEVIESNEQLLNNYKNCLESNLNSLVFGHYGYSQMKKTRIGEIPDEWDLKKLGELCLKIGDGIHKTPEYVEESEYLFVNGNNLIDNRITKTERTKCVSYSEFEKYNKELSKDTILMSINGTIGNLAFYQGEDVVFGKSVAFMSVNENELDPLFLYYLLQTNKIKTFYERELTGSTISNLSLKTIRSTPVPLPSLAVQKSISQKVKKLFESGEAISKTLVTLKSLQKSLINQIF